MRVSVCDKEVSINRSGLVQTARVAEGYEFVEDLDGFTVAIRQLATRVDLLTVTQRLFDTSRKHDYPTEWDNLAVVRISSFDEWFTRQIGKKTRNMIRKGEKSGITVREVPFDDDLVRGIAEINDEVPVRQGRKFLHYRDDLETVREVNGTFQDRSIFIGAFLGDEMIGYVKLVADELASQAGLMQILSMVKHRDKATNNLLVAQAVRSCAVRGIPSLFYAKFAYGTKSEGSLARFKVNNGFEKVEVLRYYIPLTRFGRLALLFGLHHELSARVPERLRSMFHKLRSSWYGPVLERATRRP